MATEVFENDEVEISEINDSTDEEFETNEPPETPEEKENKFDILLNEFREDLLNTFPELKGLIATNEEIKTYCHELYPKIFFDLLYENNDIFKSPQFLLPNIDFSILMKDESLSEKTKKTIWKYLQLILFTVVENINSTTENTFGDSSKLFEAIKKDELHEKITQTMEEMKDFFADISGNGENGGIDISGIYESFNSEKMNEHLGGLMDGKIGNLAREIAEEASKELGTDFTNQEEFMKTMMKNPTKIFDLVKNIGNKLDDKFNSGEVNKTELMEEATELLSKMKDIPGMKDMMSKMSGMTGNMGKMDFKAMANKLQETLKSSKTKDRLNKKREARAEQRKNVVEEFVSRSATDNIKIEQKNENMFVVNVDGTKQEKSKINKIKKNDKKKDKKKSKH
jgi:hypothetical protein